MTTVAYLLSDTARLLRRAFDARVRQLGMTSTQARFLLMLSKFEGENQGYYADLLEVEPITLCRLIDRMADSSLIERRPDPSDRRAWRIHLTERSRGVIDEVQQCLASLESEITFGLSGSQTDSLREVLEAIRANMAATRSEEVPAHG